MEKFIRLINKDRKTQSLFLILLLLFLLSLTTILNLSTKNDRSKAAEEKATILLSPQKIGIKKGDTLELQLLLKANKKNIMGIDTALKYDPSLLTIQSFEPTDKFSDTAINSIDNSKGEIHLMLLETTEKSHTEEVIHIATLKITAINNGEANLTITNAQIVALGSNTELALNPLPQGIYKITDKEDAEISPPSDTSKGNNADLVPLSFKLTDSNGTPKSIFSPGEKIYTLLTFTNKGTEQTNSQSGFVTSQIYANSTTEKKKGEPSDVNIYLRNGLFSPNYTKEYGSTPVHANTRFYKGAKFFTVNTPGTYTARVYMNSDEGAKESNYTNNQITTTYTIK